MSRRGRAIGFGLAAVLAAIAAAAIADGYGARVASGYGELRPVVVAGEALPAGEPIDPTRAGARLRLRRVPARFVPVGALRAPAEAIGLAPAATVPAGAYLLASQMHPPRRRDSPRIGRGRRPLQIAVAGAAALLSAGGSGGAAVDVVVTAEPSGSGPGRAYVAAAAVPLLALAPLPGAAAEGGALATLALTRRQALRLIAAQSFARRLTLLPRG